MILCVTHSKDFYTIDKVMAHLRKQGVTALRFNTDLYPLDIDIQFTINQQQQNIHVVGEDFRFELEEVKGVWFRKVWSSNVLDDIDENYRTNVANEIHTSLEQFLTELEVRAAHLNAFTRAVFISDNKPLQLRRAMRCGLKIPKTIITSDYKLVKDFFYQTKGNMITKLQHSLSFSMNKSEKFFPTTKITEEDLAMLAESLAICPMIFQENIPKAYELRVAYVNGQCFAGKIDSSNSNNGQTDWRNSEQNSCTWQAYTLPQAIIKQLTTYMQDIQLRFGMIDLICQPDGTYVFLEVNPSGEWGMLQKELNYPIAEAIADQIIHQIYLNG